MVSKVSIVVPVYNGEKIIGKCLDNLIKQTYKDIKIVCVNDGSTDKSLDIINKYIEKDTRISVVSQENGGLSAARNTGIKNVKTPYVMFCDCDDIFEKTMCEKMVKAIDENKTDLAACGTEVEYEAHSEMEASDENYYRIKFSGYNAISDRIILNTDVSVCDKIFRTNIIKDYGIEFPEKLNNEDYYFYNAYMSVAKDIFFVNQKLYKYIRHEGSIMSGNFDKNSYSVDHLMVAKKLFDFYKKTGFLKEHTNLFWSQFAESFWFSYEHSAKKYHKKIQTIAKEFINKEYKKYEPINPGIKRTIGLIKDNNFMHKVWKYIKGKSSRVYRKINVAYRQQDYINKMIEKMEQEIYEMLDMVEKIEKED